MSKIQTTADCEGCSYCTIDETDKARVKVICRLRDNKKLWYGMYYECDAYTKKNIEVENENNTVD